MKIVACIKYSLDVSEIKIDRKTKNVNLAGVPKNISNIDMNILEAAVSLKEAYGGSVHAVTFGPAVAQDSFREALAMGIDDVTLVEDPFDGMYDPSVTARVLAVTIEKFGDVDLIICGEVSNDGFTYQVPPRVAERLGVAQISFARKIEVVDGRVVVDRDLDNGIQTVSSPTPVLISVTEETNTPRRPTLMDAVKAKKKPVYLWQVGEQLSLSKEEISQQAAWEKIDTTGIVIDRKQQWLTGEDMSELSKQLIDLLIEEKLLEGGA